MNTEVAKTIADLRLSPSEFADLLALPRGQVSRLIVGEEEPDRLTKWALVGLRAEYRRGTDAPTIATEKLPTHPLAPELADDRWMTQTARLILPVLTKIAESSEIQTITYQDCTTK